jgi:RHS repeat-associated protein
MKKPNLFFRALCCFFAVYMLVPFSLWAQLTISVPTFPTTNTVHFTLTGTDTNAFVYDIQFTPALGTIPFSSMVTGAVGQVSFDVTKPTNANAFYRAFGTNASAPLVVATPTFSPGGGAYSTAQNVTISCATPLAAIYYTTNGATPTTSDIYIPSGDTVFLSSIVTLKAKAFRSGYADSSVASATYQINSPPVVNAGPQQVNSSTSATLQGYVTDDGLPSGSSLTNTWSKVSGPGTVTFGNLHQTNSSATFGANGIYVLQLTGTDGQYTTTNTVTIAVNTTVSVSLTAPTDGSTYTVPTNFTFAATASCSSGSITQVGFYANNVLVGTASNAPYSFDWKSVTAGTLVLTAVASTSDSANTGLASSAVTVTVNWPTNVGQVTMSTTDLQIPTAGLPITINRLYNQQYAGNGSFGYNGKLDYEQINIQESSALATSWQGVRTGSIHYYVADTAQHVVTVSLSPNEQYYFVPEVIFDSSSTNTITTSEAPNCYDFYTVHLIFIPVGQGQLSVPAPSDSVGMDDSLNGWTVPLTVVHFDDTGFPINNYEPALSDFTFTAPDGTKYNFDGSGNVSQHTDRNGNYLQYSSGGIVHSSGAQVTFTRDGNNRITQISDPIALATSGSPAVTYAYDGNGNLTNASRLVNRAGPTYNVTSYAYTNTSYPNNITAITDPRGVVSARYEYDTGGRLSRQFDALGRYTGYSYDTVNHRQVVTDRIGYATVQNFTPAGELASVQDAAGGVTSYSYDTQGRKIAETNSLGKVTTYAYDANNNLIGVTNPTGNASSTTYNNYGEPLVSIDALGNGLTNAYDANGNLIAATNALGIVSLYGYDSQGNRIAETNAFALPEQSVVINSFDQFGNLTNTIDALGNATSYTYDGNGNKLSDSKTRTLPAGGMQTLLTQYTYDAQNRFTQTIEPDGFTNLIVYNSIAKQSQIIDKLGRTNSFYYDATGLLTNTIYPDGLSETLAYDADGQKTSSVDRGGHSTGYAYDPLGRLIQTTYADGSAAGNSYDAAGNLISTTLIPPSSGMLPPPATITTAKYSYDAAGRRVALTNALSQGIRYAYDANGNQTNTADALSHTNAYVFDALNRQIQVIYPDGTSESYGYDGLDRKVAVTNQAGIVTRYGFDAVSRLVTVTNAFGTSQSAVASYRYDEVGNLLQQIDALNHTNYFECDAMGRRSKQIMPGSQAATFGYDNAGNLIRQTNFNSVVITNQYDTLNRLTNKSSAGGYKTTFAYSPTGQRTNMVDASGTNVYTYDSRDRLLTKTTPQGTLTYTYDVYGNLATIQSSTANGTSLTYGYDVLNRVTNVMDRFTNSTIYGFDDAGNLQTARLPNAVTNTYAYDNLNRLTNLAAKSSGGTIASFAYKLAQAGNRTNLVETVNSVNRTNAWSYNPLYRLTNEIITAASSGTVSYKYDGVGNRTNRTSTLSGVLGTTNTFNNNDQLTADVYDSNGNTRTNGSNTFLYDVENRLTNATVSGTNIVIVYDGNGNRVKKIVGTTTNTFLVDDRNPTGYAQVLEEKTGTNLTRTYTYGLNLISQRDASSGTQNYYGFDGNGNTRYLTSTNAVVTDTYAYDAFGNLLTSTGTTTNFYRYAGEQFDPQLGFYFLRARYMNPNTGRFLTRDSFEGTTSDPTSLHKYLYGADNPINNVDPNGNDFLSNFAFGNEVHRLIGIDFIRATGGLGFSDARIDTILALPIKIPVFGAARPDLADPSTVQVYEIKPVGSFINGRVQLEFYIQTLKFLDPLKRTWRTGSSYDPPNFLPIGFGVFAVVSPPVNGVILYEVVNIPLVVAALATYAITQIEVDVSEVILLDSLGGVAL